MKKGEFIKHDKFGVGIVEQIECDSNSIVQAIDVIFNDCNKRLLLKFAKITTPTDSEIEKFKVNLDKPLIDSNLIDSNIDLTNKDLDSNDFLKVESSLNITLPEFYKTFMTNYPVELVQFKADKTMTGEKLNIRYLKNDCDDIIETNQYFEEFELDNCFAIGDDGCGCYYAIRIDNPDNLIYMITSDGYFDKEQDKYVNLTKENFEKFVEVEANSLAEFTENILKLMTDFNKKKRK